MYPYEVHNKEMPQYQHYDAIICDGAVRSGKTLSLSLGFVMWAMVKFQNQSFALCGKTITSLERNVVRPLVSVLKDSGFQVKELLSKHCIDVNDNILVEACILSKNSEELLYRI